MPRKKEEWISGNEAAIIMTKNAGHDVSTAYVRLLAKQKKIRSRPINQRENEYYRGDVEGYVVRQRRRDASTAGTTDGPDQLAA